MNTEPFRIAFRTEGENWVAYCARTENMVGAVKLGEIKLALVQNPERKDAFIALMRDCTGDMLAAITGGPVEWPSPPVPAPEHEKAGRS